MSFSERLAVIVDADTSGGVRGWTRYTAAVSDAHKKTEKSIGVTKEVSKASALAGVALKAGIGAGAAIASMKILQFGKDAIGAASDMNESISKARVVFGQGADAVVAWGDTTAKTIGISKQEAIEAASTFGNFFEAMKIAPPVAQKMSVSMVQLAADLASFNNANPAEVLQDLRSGLAGEVEPLRKFGIDLSDASLRQEALNLGLTKTTSQVLPAGIKAQAAYSLILKQTTTAQGDFARTSSGVANQQRILAANAKDAAASFGALFLPAVQAGEHALNTLLPAVGDLAKSIAGLPPDVKSTAVSFALLFGALKLGQRALSGLTAAAAAASVKGLSVTLEGTVAPTGKLAGAVKGLGGGIKSMAAAIGPANIALGALAAVGSVIFSRLQNAAKAAADFADVVTAKGGQDLDTQIKAVSDELAKQNELAGKGVSLFGTLYFSQAGKDAADRADALTGKLKDLQHQKELDAAASGTAATAEQKLADPKVIKGVDQFGETIDRSTGKVLEAKSAIEQLNYQYDRFNSKNISADQAAINFEESLTSLAQSVHDNGKAFEGTTPEVLANRTAFINAAQAALDLSEKIGDQKGYNAGRQSMITSRQRLVELGAQLHLSAGEVQNLINRYLQLPAAKATRVTTPGIETAISKLSSAVREANNIPPAKSTTVTAHVGQALAALLSVRQYLDSIHSKTIAVDTIYGVGYRAGPGQPTAHQHGGAVQAHRPVIVGERRPEVFIPATAGTIRSSAPAGNGTGRGTVRLDAASAELLAAAITRQLAGSPIRVTGRLVGDGDDLVAVIGDRLAGQVLAAAGAGSRR